ncbi:MAG: ABC transporter ATP-binding protein [Alphaproteobacteria bacterium]|nr:ABC transporter ATP-binding protein [Alphaproteobacteria bacterium]
MADASALDGATPLVEASDLVVSFRQHDGGGTFRAVDAVSLAVAPGEVVGLVGESGSGKTTFAKAILRLYRPGGGTLRFAGRDITTLGEGALRPLRRHMQMVFQDPLSSFNPRVRIRDALALPLRLHGGVTAGELDAKVAALLARVGLGPQFAPRYPHEMSGGQLQRVAIARAIAVGPRLIVADEAVSKLDVSVRAQILNLLRDVQAETGVAMLFITHDLRVARYLCDRIGVMFFGRLVELGPTAEVFARPTHPYTRALLATLDHEGGDVAALEPPPPFAAGGCRYRTRCPIARESCRTQRPELQAVAGAGHEIAGAGLGVTGAVHRVTGAGHEVACPHAAAG